MKVRILTAFTAYPRGLRERFEAGATVNVSDDVARSWERKGLAMRDQVAVSVDPSDARPASKIVRRSKTPGPNAVSAKKSSD